MTNTEYIRVSPPVEYPGKRYNKDRYCYEHHLVWWIHTGDVVGDEYLIHHVDENKHNNNILNLELKLRSVHAAEHSASRHGGYVELKCFWCGGEFSIELRKYKSRTKNYGHSNFCCGRSCQVRKQQAERVFH